MSKPITVKQLYQLCKQEIKKNNGNKLIAISDDDECNGVHSLFFGFTDIQEFKDVCYNYTSKELEDYILLG